MKRVTAIIGLVLIVAAGIWKFAVAPRWDTRFPDGWTWQVTTFGTNLYADEKTGQFPADKKFPADDDINVSDRIITVSHDNVPAGAVQLNDHYLAKDPNTGAVTWDFTYQAVVNPVTGRYVNADFANDYFFFPRNVEKSTYQVRNTSYPGLPVAFQREAVIEGLTTYEFAYVGSYDNKSAYPDYKLTAAQGIKCGNIDLRYWVEPVTGEVVKYQELYSGDVVFDTATGKVSAYISRWSGETTSDSVIKTVAAVTTQKTVYFWMTRYLPLLLAVVGVVLIGLAVVRFPQRQAATLQPA